MTKEVFLKAMSLFEKYDCLVAQKKRLEDFVCSKIVRTELRLRQGGMVLEVNLSEEMVLEIQSFLREKLELQLSEATQAIADL